MLISVLGQTTVRFLEIRFDYTRRGDAFDISHHARNTEAALEPPEPLDNADSSRHQETTELTTDSQTTSDLAIGYPRGRWVYAPDPIGEYLESMDIQSFTLQIAQQATSLNHIGVEIIKRRTPDMWWKIIRSSESAQVSLLTVGRFATGHCAFWRPTEVVQE